MLWGNLKRNTLCISVWADTKTITWTGLLHRSVMTKLKKSHLEVWTISPWNSRFRKSFWRGSLNECSGESTRVFSKACLIRAIISQGGSVVPMEFSVNMRFWCVMALKTCCWKYQNGVLWHYFSAFCEKSLCHITVMSVTMCQTSGKVVMDFWIIHHLPPLTRDQI